MQDCVVYNHQTVIVDGEIFSNCEFTTCRLAYSGGPLPEFNGCRFADCQWMFEEAAAQTLSYLKVIWGLGAKPAVQTMIKEITAADR